MTAKRFFKEIATMCFMAVGMGLIVIDFSGLMEDELVRVMKAVAAFMTGGIVTGIIYLTLRDKKPNNKNDNHE